MTITSEVSQVTFEGNGVATTFNFSFVIPVGALTVSTITNGVETVVDSADYSVVGLGNPLGGTVTYAPAGSPVPEGTRVVITRTIPYTQPTSIENQQKFYASTVMNSLDRIVMQLQQIKDRVNRAIVSLPGESNVVSTFMLSLFTKTNEAETREALGVEIGVDVQAYSAVLAGTTASFTTTKDSKLSGIEAGADVTDAANVQAAGALMDSELAGLTAIKTLQAPDNTTISTLGKDLVGATTAPAMRTVMALGTASIATVTTSATDTTAGRVPTVGWGGVGALQPPTIADIDAFDIPAFNYRTINTTTGTFPVRADTGTAVSQFGYLDVKRYSDISIAQTYRPVGNGAGGNRTYERVSTTGPAWLPWREIHDTGTLPVTTFTRAFLATATDEASRVAIGIRSAGPVSPRAFGALGDGSNDSTAIATWLAFLRDNDAEGLVDGIFTFGSKVTVVLDGDEPGTQLRLRGTGMYRSGFIVDNASGGLEFSGDGLGRKHTYQFEDFFIEPGRAGAGVPISAVRAAGGLENHNSLLVRNVYIGDRSESTTFYFSGGAVFTGHYHPIFDNFRMSGPFNPVVGAAKWDHLVDVRNSYSPRFRTCHLLQHPSIGATYGIIAGEGEVEGFTLDDTTIDEVDYGVYLQHAGFPEPKFHINQGNICAKVRGIYLDGVREAAITGCLFYERTNDGPNLSAGVEIVNGENISFTDNTFTTQDGNSPAASAARHYILQPRVGGVVREIFIKDRGYSGDTDDRPPVLVGNGCDKIEVHGPRVLSTAATGNPSDYGTDLVEVSGTVTDVFEFRGDRFKTWNNGTAGTSITLETHSASPAQNDSVGQVIGLGKNAAGETVEYGRVQFLIDSTTDGAEQGIIRLFLPDGAGGTQIAAEFKLPAADNAACALVNMRQPGGGYALKRVQQGNADSDGTGFRTLRVAN